MAAREQIVYQSDLDGVVTAPSGGASGNIPVFGDGGTVVDSGVKPSDLATPSDVDQTVENAVTSAIGDVQMYVKQRVDSAVSAAADAIRSSIGTENFAALEDIAPEFDETLRYEAGQLVLKDGVLQICTKPGYGNGAAAFSSDATVAASIAAQVGQHVPTKTSDLDNDSGFITSSDIPSAVSAFRNDAGYARLSALAGEYDPSSEGYAVGELCSRGGLLYICRSEVAIGAEWSDDDWREVDLREVVASMSIQAHPDWAETDPESAAYIANKPNIAFAVADVASTSASGSSSVEFRLLDRTVNVVAASVPKNGSVVLWTPSASGDAAREFCVALSVESGSDVPVSLSGAAVYDTEGVSASLSAPPGRTVFLRFTESNAYGNVFTVSGYADPASAKLRELEQALDDILEDAGYVPDMERGLYIPSDDDPSVFHKVTVVTDAETGEANLKISNEGIER